MDAKTILVIVPHGDDETLMCGGTISRYAREGHNVYVAFIRTAHDERTQAQLFTTNVVKDILGFKQGLYLHLTEEEVANDFLKLKVAIENTIQTIKPEIVITTFWGDNHQDHKNTFQAVSVACRHHTAPFVKQILVGEINSSTDQDLSPDVFNPNYFVKLDAVDITNKVRAIGAYSTESHAFPHPRSAMALQALAYVRGMKINEEFAEAFMCVKQIY